MFLASIFLFLYWLKIRLRLITSIDLWEQNFPEQLFRWIINEICTLPTIFLDDKLIFVISSECTSLTGSWRLFRWKASVLYLVGHCDKLWAAFVRPSHDHRTPVTFVHDGPCKFPRNGGIWTTFQIPRTERIASASCLLQTLGFVNCFRIVWDEGRHCSVLLLSSKITFLFINIHLYIHIFIYMYIYIYIYAYATPVFMFVLKWTWFWTVCFGVFSDILYPLLLISKLMSKSIQ